MNAHPPRKYWSREETGVLERELLAKLKARNEELAALLADINDQAYENMVYRFYHQSYKVYDAPYHTRQILDALRSVAPAGTVLSPYFEEIMQAGATEKEFEKEHNQAWTQHTRPFIEAFFHARHFLEMAVKYGTILDEAPSYLPLGWAALLELYGIR